PLETGADALVGIARRVAELTRGLGVGEAEAAAVAPPDRHRAHLGAPAERVHGVAEPPRQRRERAGHDEARRAVAADARDALEELGVGHVHAAEDVALAGAALLRAE